MAKKRRLIGGAVVLLMLIAAPAAAAPPRRAEIVAVEPLFALARGVDPLGPGLGGIVRLGTLGGQRGYFQIFEAIAGHFGYGLWSAGSAAGLRARLGAAGHHELRVGLGLHFAFATEMFSGPDTNLALLFSPSASYLYRFSGGLILGFALRVLLPAPLNASEVRRYPFALVLSLPIGY